jgi:hypothetical protein
MAAGQRQIDPWQIAPFSFPLIDIVIAVALQAELAAVLALFGATSLKVTWYRPLESGPT